jgi:hypothetical protein
MRVTLSATIALTCSSSICAIRFAMVMTFMGTWEGRRHTSAFVERPSDTTPALSHPKELAERLQASAAREGVRSG